LNTTHLTEKDWCWRAGVMLTSGRIKDLDESRKYEAGG